MADIFDQLAEQNGDDLSDAPLSAYTPGQGDPQMEGGWETASGAPMHTLEMYQRGESPYVTGATKNHEDIGKKIWRDVGNKRVLVGITDYGPGVQGIDIATENRRWGKNFPYQGQRDVFDKLAKPKSTPDIFDKLSAGKPPEVKRASLALSSQEQSTLQAPQGSPEREEISKARPLMVDEIPSRFVKGETVDQVVSRSIPKFRSDGGTVPLKPEDDLPIGTRSFDEAFQTGGLLGAGAYIGQMQEMPYTRDAARAALRIFPGVKDLVNLADKMPNHPASEIVHGLEDSVVDTTAQLSAPSNLALIASGQALEGVAGKLVTGIFLSQMAKQFPDQWREFQQSRDIRKRTQLLGDMAAEAGIIITGAKSLKGGITPHEARIKGEILKEYLEPIKRGGEADAESVGTKTQETSGQAQELVPGEKEGVHIRDTPQDGVETETGEVAAEMGGPGAAGAAEKLRPDEPTAQQLGEQIGDTETGDPRTFSERIAAARSRAGQSVKNALGKAADVVKSIAVGFKKHVWDAPNITNFDRWKGRWDATLQINDYHITDLGNKLERAVKSRARQEAIYNWAAADGNEQTLRSWIDRAPPDVRKGYEDALKLSDEEQRIGNLIRSAYDEWLQRAVEKGMLEQGVENYLKRVVSKRPEIQQEIMARIGTGKFSTNFRESKRRFWNEMVDAERHGVRYDKRLRTTSLYAQSFEHAAINREFAKSLSNMTLENGRPAVIVEGMGIPLEKDQRNPAVLVTPFGKRVVPGASKLAQEIKSRHPGWSDEEALAKAREQILSEYEEFDHSAFKNWQWAHTTEDGTNIFVRGDALVHKSIVGKMKNAFLTERLQFLDPLLRAQGFVKGSKLSLSLFHQVHEMVNAFGHLTKMAGLKPLQEYLQMPEIKQAMEGGLKLVGSAHEQAYFAEGMGSHGWPELVPGLGKYVKKYKDMLFTDYIPRLKAEAYLKAYKRNVEGGLTGLRRTKNLTPEQNVVLTGRQINASFGGLNYRQMMRDPRLQQTLSGLFLAPDFGEAKLRHMGQALTRYGGEQRMSLGMVAGTLWLGSRILNQAFSGNPQWDKPFGVVVGDRQFTVRSLPGDMYHLFTAPSSYFSYRLSPSVHNAVELLFSRDAQGNVVDWSDKAKDMVLSGVPIPLTSRAGLRWSDQLASAMGITPLPYRYETEINKKIADWRKTSGDKKLVYQQEMHDKSRYLPSAYMPMRDALRDGNLARAQDELQKIMQTTGKKRDEISKAMRTWSNKPLTGSRATETKFRKTLTASDKELYDKAVKERKFIYGQFIALLRGAKYHAYPEHLEK